MINGACLWFYVLDLVFSCLRIFIFIVHVYVYFKILLFILVHSSNIQTQACDIWTIADIIVLLLMLYSSALRVASAFSHQKEVYIHDYIRNFTSVLYCGMNERLISKSIFCFTQF